MKCLLKSTISLFCLIFGVSTHEILAEDNGGNYTPKDSTSVVKTKVRADDYTSRFSISTNIVDWAWFATPNLDFQYSVDRRWTICMSAKYNNWTFHPKNSHKRNRQCRQEYLLGFRFWPWYTYSGWWVGAGAQYQEYSRRQIENIFRKEEGDAVGLSVSGGFAIHVNSWLNIDVGLGFWTGHKSYKVYESSDKSCPECGKRVDRVDGSEKPSGNWFFLPNQAIISLMFVL